MMKIYFTFSVSFCLELMTIWTFSDQQKKECVQVIYKTMDSFQLKKEEGRLVFS